MKNRTKFSKSVVEWWIKWSRIHRKSLISQTEAESELDTLRNFLSALKGYHSK
ncbi:hypothetical protein OAK75_07385 [Bacteriovoracales bacterium]|nr:hypothetical protein [Bacteriovoracales bacterium]